MMVGGVSSVDMVLSRVDLFEFEWLMNRKLCLVIGILVRLLKVF